LLTGRFLARYPGGDIASDVSPRTLFLVQYRAGLANLGPYGQDLPFERRPESVYREHPASNALEQVVERLSQAWFARMRQRQISPRQSQRGKVRRQLKRED